MSHRQNPILLKDAATPTGIIKYYNTSGFLNSVSAQLDDTATAAVIEIYVSNHNFGKGTKIATFNLTNATPSDGFSLPKEDNGWFFVRAEVVSVTGGSVKIVSACVGGM